VEEFKNIDLVLGILFLMVGAALVFVKIDRQKLFENRRTSPMFALFRFTA